MATSSALQLADLALVWSNVTGDADLVLIDNDLASDRGLLTAMLLSLFTDRRAEDDDVPPSGDERDRRGWWGDEFLEVEGDRYGSRLWLLDRSKLVGETLLRAKEYALEAWQWMFDDRVVESIDFTVERTSTGIAFEGDVHRPGKDPISFRFMHTWEHIEEDA